jgi:hypothetical protein
MADVTVATALNELEAEQICALLRSEGIPSYSTGASMARYISFANIEIRVAAENAERARELVDAGR